MGGQITIENAVVMCKAAIAKYRRLLNTLESLELQEASSKFTEHDWSRFVELIADEDVEGVRSLIAKFDRRTIGEMNITELRMVARNLGIPYYYRLPKTLLIQEIIHVRRSRNNLGDVAEADKGHPCGNGTVDVGCESTG